MARLLARYRIGYQILLLGLVGILGLAVCAGIILQAAVEMDRIGNAAATMRGAGSLQSRLRVALLEARQHTKDFLWRPDSAFVARHAASIADVETAINAMSDPEEGPLAAHPAERARLREIRGAMLEYVTVFDAISNDMQILGANEDQGLRAQLRGAAGTLERPCR